MVEGIAVALLAAALRHAAALPDVFWVHLSVSSAAPDALCLYRAAGFDPDKVQAENRALVTRCDTGPCLPWWIK
jgi:hypothetical protein